MNNRSKNNNKKYLFKIIQDGSGSCWCSPGLLSYYIIPIPKFMPSKCQVVRVPDVYAAGSHVAY